MLEAHLSPARGRSSFAAAGTVAAIGLFLSACATAPSATVYFREKPEFFPVAAGSGALFWGEKLTAWPLGGTQGITIEGDTPIALALDPAGAFVATVPKKPEMGLHLYKTPGLAPLARVNDCNEQVTISADGSLLACLHTTTEAGREIQSLRVFSLPGLSLIREMGPLKGLVHSVGFVHGGVEALVAVGSSESIPPSYQTVSHLDAYSVKQGTLVASIKQDGDCANVAFTRGGDTFVWAGKAGVQLWSFERRSLLRALSGSEALAVALSPDDQLVAYSGKGTIELVRLKDGAHVTSLGDNELKRSPFGGPGAMPISLTLVGQFNMESGRNPLETAVSYDNSGPTSYEFLTFADNTILVSSSRFGHFVVVWRLVPASP